jgi:hypothetical protein
MFLLLYWQLCWQWCMLHHITLRTWRSAALYTLSTASADCRFLSQYLHTTAVIQIHCISNKDIQCSPGEGKGLSEGGGSGRGPGVPTLLHVFLYFSGVTTICRLYQLTLSGQAQFTLQLTVGPPDLVQRYLKLIWVLSPSNTTCIILKIIN